MGTGTSKTSVAVTRHWQNISVNDIKSFSADDFLQASRAYAELAMTLLHEHMGIDKLVVETFICKFLSATVYSTKKESVNDYARLLYGRTDALLEVLEGGMMTPAELAEFKRWEELEKKGRDELAKHRISEQTGNIRCLAFLLWVLSLLMTFYFARSVMLSTISNVEESCSAQVPRAGELKKMYSPNDAGAMVEFPQYSKPSYVLDASSPKAFLTPEVMEYVKSIYNRGEEMPFKTSSGKDIKIHVVSEQTLIWYQGIYNSVTCSGARSVLNEYKSLTNSALGIFGALKLWQEIGGGYHLYNFFSPPTFGKASSPSAYFEQWMWGGDAAGIGSLAVVSYATASLIVRWSSGGAVQKKIAIENLERVQGRLRAASVPRERAAGIAALRTVADRDLVQIAATTIYYRRGQRKFTTVIDMKAHLKAATRQADEAGLRPGAGDLNDIIDDGVKPGGVFRQPRFNLAP